MEIAYSEIIPGIWLVLGVQLLLLSMAKFGLGTSKQMPLAFLCLVISMGFLRKFVKVAWEEYYFLNVIMEGRKEVFIGPLILMHLRMLTDTVSTRWVIKHLALPMLIYLASLIISLGFPSYYEGIYYAFFRVYVVVLIPILFYYFFLGIREFKHRLKPRLIPKAYQRHALFFWAFFLYYLYIPFSDLISNLYNIVGVEFLATINDLIVNNVYVYFLQTYFFVLSFFLFIYGLTETRYFKNLFLARDILLKERPREQHQYMAGLVQKHFEEARIFLDPALTLEIAVKAMGCTRKDFTDYLKSQRDLSFTEYVNGLKVNEFKLLIADEENRLYDMVSVAEMAGFRSKATFNRVFKQVEGITPREYRQSLGQSN